MTDSADKRDRAFRRFLRRVWRDDVAPLLRGRRAEQRRKSARIGGKLAAAAGLAVDSLFRLRGRPFTRALTVMGSTAGAILPDAWDWKWLRRTDANSRKAVEQQVTQAAGGLPEKDALELFDLPASASREELKSAWREIGRRWHPDKAPCEDDRAEYHLRFVAYQSAYERLCAAYDEGRLPETEPRRR